MKKIFTLYSINKDFEVEDGVPGMAAANFFSSVATLGYKNLSDIKEYSAVILNKEANVNSVYKFEEGSKDFIKMEIDEDYQAILIKPELDFRVEISGVANFFTSSKSGVIKAKGLVFNPNASKKPKM